MKLEFFKKILYPIDYLSFRRAGLDISGESIRFVEFLNESGKLSIKNFGEVLIPEESIKNGEIYNSEGLIKALSQVKNKISVTTVTVSIPEEKTYIFEIKLPEMDFSEIRDALEFRMEENVPFKNNEVYFEYEIIGQDKKDGGIYLSVSVIPKKIVEEYTNLLVSVGLFPISFEIESRIIAQTIIPSGDKRNYIIVDIKDSSTLFSFVEGGVVRFSSTLGIGESYIRNSLLKTGASLEKVEKESIVSPINVYSVIKDELEKFVDYIKTKRENNKSELHKVMVCGKSANLPGFLRHISQNLDVEIELANVWVNLFDTNEYLPPIDFDDSLNYSIAIGLAVPNIKNK